MMISIKKYPFRICLFSGLVLGKPANKKFPIFIYHPVFSVISFMLSIYKSFKHKPVSAERSLIIFTFSSVIQKILDQSNVLLFYFDYFSMCLDL